MTFDSEALLRAAPAAHTTHIEDAEARAIRRERIVVVAATSVAVLVVATIAVLMGMA